MSKKMFTIGIPCIFTGILFVVVMGIYGLNNVDKTLAKANAKKAFSEAYTDFVESEVDITRVFRLYGKEKFRIYIKCCIISSFSTRTINGYILCN